jgi:two-component system sensor histidine kinase RegB
VATQILVDLGLLGAMLWFSGGVTNPFACFLGFHTVLAGLLGSRRTIVWATVATVVVAVALLAAAPLPLSGASLDVLANAVSIVALAGITGFMVTLFARQLDELREQSARSEKLAGLGRTVAAICHELNTPLGTIVIAGKDLALIGRESGSSDVQELSSTIVNEAQRASSTIGLMRGYVGLSEKRGWVDLAAFVPSYADRQLDQIGYRGKRSYAISRLFPISGAAQAEARPVSVLVLEAALCHVLANVLANAVEAMADTAAPSIEVRVTDEDGSATVAIRDNGKGVSAELAQRLGEPFQTTKTAQGGRGLGLYICSLLVDEMSGKLRLDSTPGQGTEVTLALPRGEGAEVR